MDEPIKVIVFQLNEEQYGVNIQQVLSIEKLTEITSVPKAVHYMKGFINLRGEITPIIDLKERLQIGESKMGNDTRILIVNVNDIQVGLIVDSATEVIDLNQSILNDLQELWEGLRTGILLV